MGRKSDARERLMSAVYELTSKFSYGAVTIESICDQAGVQKGTFYHFFDSKSDLMSAAIKAWWDERKCLIEKVFQAENPPLDRIRNYLDSIARYQLQVYEKSGQIIGGPIFRLGSEISTQDERIRLLVNEIITSSISYFEESIREAQALGQMEGDDAALKARMLWAFYAGTIMRARVENNPELIRTLSSDALKLIAPSFLGLPSIQEKSLHDDRNSKKWNGFQVNSRATEPDEQVLECVAEFALMRKPADVMVVLTDAAGRMVWVNDAFVRTCGYSLEELRGNKPGRLLQGPESDPVAVKILHNAVHSGNGCVCRIINYKKDGTPYPVFIWIRPVFDEGKLDGFFAIAKDLTEDEVQLVVP